MWIKKGVVFNKHWAQLPVVDTKNDNFWRVFYSHRIENKSYPKYFDIEKSKPSNVLFEQVQPFLSLGELGTFDQAGVMPTEIVNYNDKKYLYYIGWSNRKDVPYFNTIGLAISEDKGKTYKKFSTGPVFGCSYKEPGYTGTMSILIENNIWRAWYLSCRKWEEHDGIIEPFYDIKYAESVNGYDWQPFNLTCIPLIGQQGGVSQAKVVRQNNKYYMWYSIRNKTDYRNNKINSYRIKCAVSNDGFTWNINDKIDLDISEEGWDSIMVEYPYVVIDNNQKFMFYNGNGFGKEGIGYATASLKGE
jgi:hypothetical protein